MENNLADYTWYLFAATVALACIALAQAVLFLWQLVYMRRGLKDTAAAAKAAEAIGEKQVNLTALHADIAEKAKEIERLHYFGANRPKLEVKFIKPLALTNNQVPETVSVSIINTGTTEAIMTGSRISLTWMREGEIPDPHELIGNPVVGPRRFKPGATDRTLISVEGSNRGGINLYLMGWIVYFDGRGEEFGDSHTTYFLRQWNGGRFEVPKGLPDWDFLF